MNNYKYHYHFTTFDIETFDLNNFRYNFVNMTAFRMLDTAALPVQSVLEHMRRFEPLGQHVLNSSHVIKLQPALIYDSVHAFAYGVNALIRSASLTPANLSCEQETPWTEGSSLFNYVNAVQYFDDTPKVLNKRLS